MDIARIYKNIKMFSAWFQYGANARRRENEEILKPLNKLIDFEKKECIYENNFHW
ncbi:MAG: hypothetical protein ACTSYB_12260 [Candidatus Helarchaeota archaeon]